MKVTRVLHTSVNVTGAHDETVAFYRDVFGLESAARPDIGIPGHWFGLGEGELHLVGSPPFGSGIDPTGNHYCVGVPDIDDAIAELDERGIPYFRGAQGDVVQIWITDPAGNTIELQQDA